MKHPIQPLIDGRFKKNVIVDRILEEGGIDLNQIALWDVSQDDRIQFAQLIGYSLSGFGTLSYVDDETYCAAELMQNKNKDENVARLEVLHRKMNEIRAGLKAATVAAFEIHPSDLNDFQGT